MKTKVRGRGQNGLAAILAGVCVWLGSGAVTLAATYYVDVDNVGGGGTGANDPYPTLAGAITTANGVTGPHSLYIASGLYADVANGGTEDYSVGGGVDGGYLLDQNISIYGGYAGWDGGSGSDWTEGSRVLRSTVIDLQGAGSRAFYHSSSATKKGGIFDGLTLRNANHAADGGAIWDYGNNSRLYVRNSLFTNNVTTGEGGAVRLHGFYAYVVIEDCDFVDNSALRSGAARLSAAPSNYEDSLGRARITVQRSTFTRNSATEYAGAVDVPAGGPLTIEDCEFVDNVAGSYGGVLRVTCPAPGHAFNACRNRFSGNASTSGAAVVSLLGSSASTLDNNLFVGNTGPYAIDSSGVSLTMRFCTLVTNESSTAALYTSKPLTLRNTILASNGPLGIQRSGTPSIDVDYNNVWGHTTANYDGLSAGTNDISADPAFIDALNGDFQLAKDSPCIDAGVDVGVTTDFDSHPRPARDGFDIGCYEEWQMPVIVNRAEIAESDAVTLRAEFTYEHTNITTYGWFVLDTTNRGTADMGAWWQSTNSGEQTQDVVFAQAFTGLSPDTTYYWCCVGSNDYDVVWGSVATFTTPSAGGVVCRWTGTGGNALASNGGNWQGGTAPTANDYVLLDPSVSNMTWDAGTAGLPDTVARWTQTENYLGTVTFGTYYPSEGAFTNFIVTGDCMVQRGTWKQVSNSSGDTAVRRLYVTVGGDFMLGSTAAINVDGQGFLGNYGPGNPIDMHDGAGHGGHGSAWGGIGPSGFIYGSVTHPDTLGSGSGRGNGGSGGGAVILAVTGDVQIDGTITADGIFTGDTNGSGGTINIVARILSGSGTLGAAGGTGSYTASGGGRIAVKLTQTGADFSGFTGTMTAYGGLRTQGGVNGGSSGAAGTVYTQTGSQTDGYGTLIIDNGDHAPYLTGICTVMPAGQSLHDFSEIILTNKGNLGVTATDTLNLDTTNITVSGVDSSYITVTDTTGLTFPDPYTIADYTLVADTPIVATGDWTIAASGNLTHGENYHTNESFKLDLSLTGDLTIDGTINVNRKGFRGGYGPGAPTHSYGGASYGGYGGFGYGGSTLVNIKPVYGSIVNPVNVGSGGGRGDGETRAGGGAVVLNISGNLAVNGSICSEAEYINDTSGSGGTINITAGTLSGSGPISANAAYGYIGGGGGRVAVNLTEGGADFSSYTGVISAYGGNFSTALRDGAPGTVYLSAPGLVPSPQLRIVNFDGASCGTGVVTEINQAEELRETALYLSAGAQSALLQDTAIADIVISLDSFLTLGTNVLDICAFEHHLDDLDADGEGATNLVDNYDQIIWSATPPGTVFFFR